MPEQGLKGDFRETSMPSCQRPVSVCPPPLVGTWACEQEDKWAELLPTAALAALFQLHPPSRAAHWGTYLHRLKLMKRLLLNVRPFRTISKQGKSNEPWDYCTPYCLTLGFPGELMVKNPLPVQET